MSNSTAILLQELRTLRRSEEQILRYIYEKAKTTRLEQVTVSRKTLARWTQFSEPTIKRALDTLQSKGYIYRRYKCTCGTGLGIHYNDIQSVLCPCCGTLLYRNVLVELRLSTRGKNLLTNITVCNLSNLDYKEIYPSDQAIEFARNAAKMLGVTSINQINDLAKYYAWDLKNQIHKITDWKIALAFACQTYKTHNSAILNLKGVIKYYLRQIDENRKPYQTIEVEVPTTIKMQFENLLSLSILPINEYGRMGLITCAYELYQENPWAAAAFDKMTADRGLLPRILTRPEKIKVKEIAS